MARLGHTGNSGRTTSRPTVPKDVLLSLDSVCLRIDDNARVLRLRAYLVDLEAHHKEEIGPRAVYGVGRIRVEICGAAG